MPQATDRTGPGGDRPGAAAAGGCGWCGGLRLVLAAPVGRRADWSQTLVVDCLCVGKAPA